MQFHIRQVVAEDKKTGRQWVQWQPTPETFEHIKFEDKGQLLISDRFLTLDLIDTNTEALCFMLNHIAGGGIMGDTMPDGWPPWLKQHENPSDDSPSLLSPTA